jgi:hypothetical protein
MVHTVLVPEDLCCPGNARGSILHEPGSVYIGGAALARCTGNGAEKRAIFLSAPQRPIEIERRADERQMEECLREVAQGTLGESKRGSHSQSIEPAMPTNAAVRRLPMIP